MGSEFGELYRYIHKVYENAVSCGLLYVVKRTAVYGLGVIHLVYNALRDFPGGYSLCTHSLSELFGSDLGELYRYVQKVHENTVCYRL